jgi:hypothetical protein
MSSIDKSIADLYEKIELSFRRFYNFHQLTIYKKKIECFRLHGTNPNDYYECFNAIEKETMKDVKTSKLMYQELEDELKICKFDCKSLPPNEMQKCMEWCDNQTKNIAIEQYRRFYREKISKEEFEYLKKLVKV